MEQNQDGLEYSSEDEKKKKTDLQGELNKLKERGKKDLAKVAIEHYEIDIYLLIQWTDELISEPMN